MKLTFLGTGEAFDINRGNASYLLEANERSIMVDCGYKTPYSLMKVLEKEGRSFGEVPDSLAFTHFHGDHFAGISALLLPIWDYVREHVPVEQRPRKLSIVSALENPSERVGIRMREDYGKYYDMFRDDGFEIDFRQLNPEDVLEGVNVRAVQIRHSFPNMAYRFDHNGRSVAISGDGELSHKSGLMYKGVDLLIHEAYNVHGKGNNHATMEEVVAFAITSQIPKVGIVHMNQHQRIDFKRDIEKMISTAKEHGVDVFSAEDHQTINI